ncbi:competence protein TfoX [Brotonthovivens ammoniilytica]|uniref:competence protein TfoX n=1 Tax=Brotonthovivens ammoniilytica TaxID=2981725 RepID=UPI003A8785FA
MYDNRSFPSEIDCSSFATSFARSFFSKSRTDNACFNDTLVSSSRLLVKPVPSAISLIPTVTYELPYEGAKEMLLVDDVDNREFLCNLFLSMYNELPIPKKKKTTSKK